MDLDIYKMSLSLSRIYMLKAAIACYSMEETERFMDKFYMHIPLLVTMVRLNIIEVDSYISFMEEGVLSESIHR